MTSGLESFAPVQRPERSARALSRQTWNFAPHPGDANGAKAEPSSLDLTAPIASGPKSGDAQPATAGEIKAALKSAGNINITSEAEDQKSGKQADYILKANGQLVKNPNAKPGKDGSLTVEVQGKQKSETDAKKVADQLQKAQIKDLINYFKSSHPKGTKLPQDWLNMLNKEPDLPDAPMPLGDPSDNSNSSDGGSNPSDGGSGSQSSDTSTPSDNSSNTSAPATSDSGGTSGGGASGSGEAAVGGSGSAPSSGESSSGSSEAPAISGSSGSSGATDATLPPAAGGTGSSAPLAANGLLTTDQQTFANELSKETGLDSKVVAAWVLSEESGSAAQGRQADNNNDWLNIGYTGSGTYGASDSIWSDPKKAADATAEWLQGQNSIPNYGTASSGIQHILDTKGESPQQQIEALQTSGWAGSGYPDLPGVYNEVASATHTEQPAASASSSEGPKSGDVPPVDQNFAGSLLSAISTHDQATVGGGLCATAVQEALDTAGLPQFMGSGDGWPMGQKLLQSGLFQQIPASEAQPGDIIARPWAPNITAENGGTNEGDISVVIARSGNDITQGNDAHYQFDPTDARYDGQAVFMRYVGEGGAKTASNDNQPSASSANSDAHKEPAAEPKPGSANPSETQTASSDAHPAAKPAPAEAHPTSSSSSSSSSSESHSTSSDTTTTASTTAHTTTGTASTGGHTT